MDNAELYHHGIKGMRWGVRRYQNKDGSLTKAGQARYNRELSRLKAEKKKITATKRTQAKLSKLDDMRREIDEEKRALNPRGMPKRTSSTPEPQRRKLSELSNDEIQAKIDRMNLEKRYRELAQESLSNVPKKEISKGRKFAEEILDAAGKDIGKQAAAWMLGTATNKVLEKVFDEKNIVDPKHIQKNKK